MQLKKRKAAQPPRKGLLGNADDYEVCRLGLAERILTILAGALAGGAVCYIFYERLILAVLVGAVFGALCPGLRRRQKIAKRKERLLSQFRDCLESLSTSLGSGSNVPRAFEAAAGDMAIQYGEESDICREVAIINEGISDNINVELLLMDFGERSGIVDIKNFADVFEICYRKGGNIREIVKSSYQIICDKVDVQLEINTAVASKKMEQNAMLVMPVVFIFLLKMMGSDIIDLHSVRGILSTTAGLACFIAAYIAGKKILKIDL